MNKGFIIYSEYEQYFDMLPAEEVQKLLKALFVSFKGEDSTNLIDQMDGMTKMAFAFMNDKLVQDRQKYIEKCAINRANASGGNRTQADNGEPTQSQANASEIDNKNKNININKNIVVVDKLSTNNSARACEETTTSTTTSPLIESISSLCQDIEFDCDFDCNKYNLDLLVSKIKESRYLRMFRSLKELLGKYDEIIADKYKDFTLNKILSQRSKDATKHTYTKEEYDSLFDSVDEI